MERQQAKASRLFETTHWSVVLALRDPDPACVRQALERLCASYWYPLYAFVRHQGYSPEEAEDAVQGFFEHLLEHESLKTAERERGRFSSFLVTCLRHYLAAERRRAGCQKRGGGHPLLSLDVSNAEARYKLEPARVETPDEAFERHWAMAVVEGVFDRLEAETTAGGKRELFVLLKGVISGEKGDMTCAEIAQGLGLSSSALRMALHRLRARYRELFRAEVGRLVERPEEVDAEIQHLFRVLTC